MKILNRFTGALILEVPGNSLFGADLFVANLFGANLTPIRDDVWAVLSSSPREARGLLDALNSGHVDGSTYAGECACLVGTIANVADCYYMSLPALKPDASRPAERFFLGIRRGDTPSNSEHAKLAAEWISQWIKNMKSAFGPTKRSHHKIKK